MTAQNTQPSSKLSSAAQVRLFSLQDAATFLSVSYWTLRNLVWRGDLPSVQVGRRILIDREDLERFIESRKQVESL